MAAITVAEFKARLVDLCLKSGLTGFPRGRRDRHILLRSVADTLDPAVTYRQDDVTDRLAFWFADIGQAIELDRVSLRRLMVDYGYLVRDKAGTSYRVRIEGRGEVEFGPGIAELDVYEVIGAGRKAIQEQKRRYAGPR